MAQDQLVSSPGPYPYLAIRVEIRGVRFEGLALLDTGYTGELAIPESALTEGIGDPIDETNIHVADNRIVHSPTYLGQLDIPGLSEIPGVVVNVLGDEYILGLGILDLFEVTFDHGQRVIVRP
jgi:predicted aspartyl protease